MGLIPVWLSLIACHGQAPLREVLLLSSLNHETKSFFSIYWHLFARMCKGVPCELDIQKQKYINI